VRPKSAVRLLGESHVEEIRAVAKVSELILVPAAAFELTGVREKEPRLADEIE